MQLPRTLMLMSSSVLLFMLTPSRKLLLVTRCVALFRPLTLVALAWRGAKWPVRVALGLVSRLAEGGSLHGAATRPRSSKIAPLAPDPPKEEPGGRSPSHVGASRGASTHTPRRMDSRWA